MTTIINKTPHPVYILDEKNKVIVSFPKAEALIRLSSSIEKKYVLCNVPITITIFGDPIGLPDMKEETFYIVSQLVKSALPTRDDLLVPAEVVRDEKGNIIGCRSLGI